MRRALGIILAIALVGLAFSGTLTWQELFAHPAAAQTCPSPGRPGTVFGYPACVYGFLMYALVAAVAGWGLWKGRRGANNERAVDAGAPLQRRQPA